MESKKFRELVYELLNAEKSNTLDYTENTKGIIISLGKQENFLCSEDDYNAIINFSKRYFTYDNIIGISNFKTEKNIRVSDFKEICKLLIDENNFKFKFKNREVWNGNDGRGNNPYDIVDYTEIKLKNKELYVIEFDYKRALDFAKDYWDDKSIESINLNIVQ